MIRPVLTTCSSFLSVVLLVGSLSADESPTPPPPEDSTLVTRLLRIEHADVDDVASTLSAFPGQYKTNQETGIILWTGPDRLADAVTAAARELDVARTPAPNVNLAVWLVVASRRDDLEGGLPEGLAPVERELRQVLGFAGFALLESTSLRVRAGSGGRLQGGTAPLANEWNSGHYVLRFGRISLSGSGDSQQVRIDDLTLDLTAHLVRTLPGGASTTSKETGGIRTDLDVLPEQFAVVGQFTIPGTEGTTLLVLRADVQGYPSESNG